MFHAPRHRSESLIETIVAVSVIVLATTASLSLLRTAVLGNQVIGEKLVALNLALEGIEAVRNIRDSNYLNFPDDPDQCWNTLAALEAEDCPFEEKIEEGVTYYLTRNLVQEPLFEWDLEVALEPQDGLLTLYSMTDYGNLEIYAQSGLEDAFEALMTRAFKRTITVDYSIPNEAFEATVLVQWDVAGEWQGVSLTRTLANVH